MFKVGDRVIYEVGDRVIYEKEWEQYRAKVFGVTRKKGSEGRKYAIEYYIELANDIITEHSVVKEKHLKPIRKDGNFD